MAHFAQLDANNIVTNVIVVNNNAIKDEHNVESEAIGVALCKSLYGENTNWKQTSYNGAFRSKFASFGDFYNESLDCFMRAKPFPSWTANTVTHDWDPPIPEPDDLNVYSWDEENQKWILYKKSLLSDLH